MISPDTLHCLGEFSRFLETFSTLPDLLEFGLDQATKISTAAQGSLYLYTEKENHFRLEMCSGSCPLELSDVFALTDRRETSASKSLPEITALERRQIVRCDFTLAGTKWERVALPLFLAEETEKSPPFGVLLLHFSQTAACDDESLRELATRIVRSIVEIKALEAMRAQRYAKARALARDAAAGQVAVLAGAIAEEMGINEREIEEIKIAAFLRDVGLNEDFLREPRALTIEEWERVREHTKRSEKLLVPYHLPSRISLAVRQHHESFDGSGYPEGLGRDEISFAGRVLAVADTFHALTSERPYRKALSLPQALGVVQELAGKQFDPAIVSCLPFAIIRLRCEPEEKEAH